MKRLKQLSVACAAWALIAAPVCAEDVSAKVGVTVTVPEGFSYLEGFRPKPTTVLAFTADEGDAQIVINSIKTSKADTLDSLAEAAKSELKRSVTFVTVPAGRMFRFDLEFPDGDPPTNYRQRIYMTVHEGRVFQFVLHDAAASFEGQLARFDELVGGVRFGPVAADPPADPPMDPPADSDPPVDPPVDPPADMDPPVDPPVDTDPPVDPPADPPADSDPPVDPPADPPVDTDPPVDPSADSPADPPVDSDPPADPPAPTGEQTNLLSAARLVSFTSEYASDYWAAKNLTDGSTARTQSWASRPGKKPPHRFVFQLERAAQLFRVEFENTGDESGIEGASAKGFRVEVSELSAQEGFKVVLDGNLKGEAGTQGFLLPANTRGEWVRLTLTGNHGNATLTELAELRLFGPQPTAQQPVAAESGKLRVERLRVSQTENGAAHEGAFAPGSRVWVCFKPRGMRAAANGTYSIEVDLILEDGKGNALLTRERVLAHTARLPAPPLSPFVAVFLDLPKQGFPAGTYGVRLAVRDTLSKSSAGAATPFEVSAE